MTQEYNIFWLQEQRKQEVELDFFYFWEYHNDAPTKRHCFSHWHKCPFTVDNITYPTMEHWMMAQKALLFEDYAQYKRIMAAPTPAYARALGSEIAWFDIEVWGMQQYDIGKLGNIHKFNQYPSFAALLLQTEQKILVEATLTDAIWGLGMDESEDAMHSYYIHRSINLSGFTLMGARDFLRTFGHFEPLENALISPWQKFPDESSTFWNEGPGQDYLVQFSAYYNSLDERNQTIYRLTNPVPYDWIDIYEECKCVKLYKGYSITLY